MGEERNGGDIGRGAKAAWLLLEGDRVLTRPLAAVKVRCVKVWGVVGELEAELERPCLSSGTVCFSPSPSFIHFCVLHFPLSTGLH